MKKTITFLLCAVLLLLVLPIFALAGDSCTEGIHDLSMVDVKYPTCETDGYMVLECNNCNYKKTEITDKAWGHDWKDDGTTYPDCENPGLEKMYCANCDKKWSSVISALGHNWKDAEIVQDATCEMSGTSKDVCENCGKELLHEIKPKGHNWKNTKIIKKATCTQEGKAEAVCRDCGKEGTRTLKKLAHTYSEWTIIKQATEKVKGKRSAVCDVCGKKTTEAFDYVPGDIAIYTTASKVNLRAGAGKGNKQMGQVAKKGTYLGQLYEAAPDKNGTVWYKVKYKEKYRWVMSDFAEARVETDTTKERLPQATGTELTSYFFMSAAPVAEVLELNEAEDASSAWQNDVVYISGAPYVEQIVLMDKGYSLYGIKVGDKISNALKVLKKKNLVLESDQADLYTYRIPALAEALSVDDEGFCGYLEVVVADDATVQAICLYADTVEQRFTSY